MFKFEFFDSFTQGRVFQKLIRSFRRQLVNQDLFRLLVARWREVYSFLGIWGPLNFQKATSKIEVFLALPCWLSQLIEKQILLQKLIRSISALWQITSDAMKIEPCFKMTISGPFLVIFSQTACISFTKIRFRWSFWGV